MTFAGKGTAGVMLTLDSSGNAIFAGSKISGSSTSTGSFGSLIVDGVIQGATEIGGDLTITDATPALTFNDTNEHPSRISGNGSHVTLQADYNNTGAGSRIDFEIDGTNQARLYGPTGDLTLYYGGVSGSSDSTGSFGAGYIDNKLGIGTLIPEEELSIKNGAIQLENNQNLTWSDIGLSLIHI